MRSLLSLSTVVVLISSAIATKNADIAPVNFAAVAAAPLYLTSNFATFRWEGDSAAARETFKLTAQTPTKIQVVDYKNRGDSFEVFDNGVSLGMTSKVDDMRDEEVFAATPEEALKDERFSKGIFELGQGDHKITIKAAGPYNAGTAAIRMLDTANAAFYKHKHGDDDDDDDDCDDDDDKDDDKDDDDKDDDDKDDDDKDDDKDDDDKEDCEHGHDEHGHDEHGHDEHGHDEHGHDEHGHDEHGHDEHGHDEHGHDEHGHDEHGHDEHGHDEHGHDEHGHDEHGHDEHGHDEHGHDEHGHDEHGHDEHGHDEHGHDEHGDDGHGGGHGGGHIDNIDLDHTITITKTDWVKQHKHQPTW